MVVFVRSSRFMCLKPLFHKVQFWPKSVFKSLRAVSEWSMYINVQLLSKPSCLPPWLGHLTTTPHYWPLHYKDSWCGWTTMTEKKREEFPQNLNSIHKRQESCVSSSVANWCSNKCKRRVSKNCGGPWGWLGAYRGWTGRKKSFPLSSSLTDPSFRS